MHLTIEEKAVRRGLDQLPLPELHRLKEWLTKGKHVCLTGEYTDADGVP